MNTTTTIPSFLTTAAAASASSATTSSASKSVQLLASKNKHKATTPGASSKAVRAILRVRPLLAHKESPAECLRLDPQNPTVVNLNDNGVWSQYTLDHCLPPTATQDDVFAHVQAMLDDAFTGMSATVFAYGMTGSGKTFTIEGNADNRGVVYRSAQYLFQQAPKVKKARSLQEIEVHMAMFELYMDTIEDLLIISKQSASARPGGPLKAKAMDKVLGNMASGTGSGLMGAIRSKLVADTCQEYRQVQTKQVANYDQFVALYQRGLKSRATGATNLNAKSSRSHLFVQLVIVSRSALPTADITFAKVNLVDLAGSENNKKTGNKGLQMDESKAINSSLFALDKVVTALNRAKRGHVPYGDSKLTKILKDSLGGNAQALIIANAGPSLAFAKETKATLAFATKSVEIINTPVANTVVVAPAPPPAPTAPASRKRPASADSGNTLSPPSPKRPRTDRDPTILELKKGLTTALDAGLAGIEASVEAKVNQLVTAAVTKLALPVHATPARPPPPRPLAGSLGPGALSAHTPRTARLLAQDLLQLARKHVLEGNVKLARVHFESVLADTSVDPGIRDVCARELAACRLHETGASASASTAATRKKKKGASARELPEKTATSVMTSGSSNSGGKGKRQRSDTDDSGECVPVAASSSKDYPPVAAINPLTPTSKALANAARLLAKLGNRTKPTGPAAAHPPSTSALARPPLSYSIAESDNGDHDAPAPKSPSVSKSSGGRAKRAKSSNTPPDFSMSQRAMAYFVELVNCGDAEKISTRFAGLGKKGKAKLIVDYAKVHGGIRAASDLLGIVGFGEKTVMSMVEAARVAVGEYAVEDSRGSGGSGMGSIGDGQVLGKENVSDERSRNMAAKESKGGERKRVVVVIDD